MFVQRDRPFHASLRRSQIPQLARVATEVELDRRVRSVQSFSLQKDFLRCRQRVRATCAVGPHDPPADLLRLTTDERLAGGCEFRPRAEFLTECGYLSERVRLRGVGFGNQCQLVLSFLEQTQLAIAACVADPPFPVHPDKMK